jgi:hypothetical protein
VSSFPEGDKMIRADLSEHLNVYYHSYFMGSLLLFLQKRGPKVIFNG